MCSIDCHTNIRGRVRIRNDCYVFIVLTPCALSLAGVHTPSALRSPQCINIRRGKTRRVVVSVEKYTTTLFNWVLARNYFYINLYVVLLCLPFSHCSLLLFVVKACPYDFHGREFKYTFSFNTDYWWL